MPSKHRSRGVRSSKPPPRERHNRPHRNARHGKKVPAPTKKIQRPGRWWRTPLPAEKLKDLPSDEAAFLVAQERLLKTEQLKDQLRELRAYSSDFDAAKGFPLREADLIRLAPAKLRKIKRAYATLKHAQSQPFVTFSPKTTKQKRAAKLRAGEILPGQRKFLIHHGDARLAQAEWKDGEIQITTRVKGGEIYERIYFFPRRPRSWKEVIRETKALQRRGMRSGYYKIYNTVYGPIGELVDIDALVDALEQFFSTYNKWLAGTILGWVWMSTSIDVARKKQRKHKTTAERFQEQRKALAQREQDRLKRRLGIKVPKRRRRRR